MSSWEHFSQLLYAGVPLFTAIIVFVVFKQTLSVRKTAGILIGFLGVSLIILLPVIQMGHVASGNIIGNLLILLGVLCYSLYMAFSKKFLSHTSPFGLTGIFIFTTTVILLPFFIFDLYTHSGWWRHLSAASVFAVLYVAIVATIITYLLNQYAIKHGGSVYASTALYLTPVFAYLAAFLLLGEQLSMGVLVGGALAIGGTYLVLRK